MNRYIAGDLSLGALVRDFSTRDWDGPPEDVHGDVPAPSDNSWGAIDIDPRLDTKTYRMLAAAFVRSQGKAA